MPAVGEPLDEVMRFVDDFDGEYVVTAVDSPLFRQTFFEEQKNIVVLEVVNGKGIMMRLSLAMKHWGMFQLRHEWVRSLWSHEFRTVLYEMDENSERLGLQNNSRFLNNMICQACDIPVGYPAYVSGIID
jgi:hypothetical protein